MWERIVAFFRKTTKQGSLTNEEQRAVNEFSRHLGVTLNRPELMRLALTHRSFLHNNGGANRESNERLEYLGDSVLGLVCSEWLYRNRPSEHEGQLTKTKSLLVSKAILSRRALAMGLGRFVLLSSSEVESGGRQRLSILADAFEAVIGAIYLDQGLDAAREFITTWLLNEANGIIADKRHTNYKSLLQEYVQSTFHTHPIYRIRSETGPDHQKVFTVDVLVGSRSLGEGRGENKKEAEQDAARDALDRVAAKSAPRRSSARGERGERARTPRSRGTAERSRTAGGEMTERRGAKRAPRDRGERPERAERPDRTERPIRAERADRIERPIRVERTERPERPERVERSGRTERSRPTRSAGRSSSTERQRSEDAEPRRRRSDRSVDRGRGKAAAVPAVESERPRERSDEDLAASASTAAEIPVSVPDDDSPERTPSRERRAARQRDESPKPVREEIVPEESKPEPSPVESRPVAPAAPATGVVYGRSGKRATRGLHSQAARAELEAAKPREEPSQAMAESPVFTPQRHGSLGQDSNRDYSAPEVEIVRESGSTPAGAPSDRYRAAESGGSEDKGEKRREREETSVDPDEKSEP